MHDFIQNITVNHLSRIFRGYARKHLLTMNTIRYRVEFPRIIDAFRIIGKQASVLDGGAGGGQMLRMVYEAGYCEKGVALEYDEELYGILKNNYHNLPAFEAIRGSLLDIPFPDSSFDCVMTTQVLEHIEDHERAASELGRILKPGGHLIISVPHPPEPFHTPGHIREGYTESDLISLFPAPSFLLRCTGYSMTRPTIDRVIRASKLPFGGKFMPSSWADRETMISNAERKEQFPYGITCLFQKSN